MPGTLFDIQRFAVNDGPGIRTTVFLKGCPLRCVWCHNPESQSAETQLGFQEDKCTLCGKCVEVCPEKVHLINEGTHHINFEDCTTCGRCVEACPNGALRIYGYTREVTEIMQEVVKDIPYYNSSGGGITLSGGEPLFQYGFAVELLQAARHADIQTCVDTSGYIAADRLTKVTALTDIFLFDYKITDSNLHLKHTGVLLSPILENLRLLNQLSDHIILRCPIIPGINFNESHRDAIASLAVGYESILQVDLLPYHTTGNSKYHRIGNLLPFKADNLDSEALLPWQNYISRLSGKVVTIG